MSKLNEQFDEFLSNIEPDEEARKYAQEAHKPIREHLEEDEEFGEFFEGSFLYGSYARHTAVDEIKDIDIVVLTNFDPNNLDHSPKKVLKKLKKALNKYYEDADSTEYQRKSIKVKDPLPDYPDVYMTLDIIPAIELDGEDSPLLVPDIETDTWVKSHPRAHMEYTRKLNDEDHCSGNFVPLVKMMKHWWNYNKSKKNAKPKGFWLEVLTGNIVNYSEDTFVDYFISTLENILERYKNYEGYISVPELDDPGLANEIIKTSMTIEEFRSFMDTVKISLDKAKEARDEEDSIKSSKKWNKIFGEEFPIIEEVDEKSEKGTLVLGNTDHAKSLIWPYSSQYKVSINAYIYTRVGGNLKKLGGLNSDGRQLRDDVLIKYQAKTTAVDQYEVKWQVVNTGIAAKEDGGLRGDFFDAKLTNGSKSSNPLVNWEHTKYTGKHWIECFIIQNNDCVARSGKFYVNIKSSKS